MDGGGGGVVGLMIYWGSMEEVFRGDVRVFRGDVM